MIVFYAFNMCISDALNKKKHTKNPQEIRKHGCYQWIFDGFFHLETSINMDHQHQNPVSLGSLGTRMPSAQGGVVSTWSSQGATP